MIRKDLSGQIINGLKLNKRIEDYMPPSGGKGLARYNCTCQLCNNNIDLSLQCIKNRVRDGCGCVYNNIIVSKPWKRHDITNQRFGYCVAQERLNNGKWKCLCDCGNSFIASISHLTSGHTKSCGCYRKENSKNMHFIDLTGKKFGELYVEKFLYTIESKAGVTRYFWKCLCSCGTYTIVDGMNLRAGDTKSCGCIGASYREKCIRSSLNNKNINYTTEYTFNDLRYKYLLRFDFAIFDSNNTLLGLIEHQGRQHFEEYSKTTQMGKLQREVTDKMKSEYCQEHNIPLYLIRFDEDIEIRITNILAELHVNTVPSSQETA